MISYVRALIYFLFVCLFFVSSCRQSERSVAQVRVRRSGGGALATAADVSSNSNSGGGGGAMLPPFTIVCAMDAQRRLWTATSDGVLSVYAPVRKAIGNGGGGGGGGSDSSRGDGALRFVVRNEFPLRAAPSEERGARAFATPDEARAAGAFAS